MPTLRLMVLLRPQRTAAAPGLLLLGLLGLAAVWGCASEEIPKYGEPQRVGGGVGGGSGGSGTTSSGGACEVDTACAVKFSADVFPILDGKAKCAFVPGCHGDGKGGLTLTENDIPGYYSALTSFKLKDGSSNIVPCDLEGSKMLCNLRLNTGDNPHGICGTQLMPPNPTNAPTLDELTIIEDWITCGAPNN